MLVLVHRVHRQQSQPIADVTVERHTQVAGGVADHEGHHLGSGLLGGEDEVALVLAVFVVDDDHGLARRYVGNRPFDGVQPRHPGYLAVAPGRARAHVSTSMNHDMHAVIAAAFGAQRRRAHSWPRCDDHHRLEVLRNGSISVGPQGDLKAFISVSAGKLSAHEYSYARKAVAAPLYGRAGGRWYYRVRPRVGHGGRASGAWSRTGVSLVPGPAMEPRLGQQLGLE